MAENNFKFCGHLVAFIDILGQSRKLKKLNNTRWWDGGKDVEELILSTYGHVLHLRNDLNNNIKAISQGYPKKQSKQIFPQKFRETFDDTAKSKIIITNMSDSIILTMSLEIINEVIPVRGIFSVIKGLGITMLQALSRGIYFRAGFRNSDYKKGVELCRRTHPGVHYLAQEKIIHHVVSKDRKHFVEFLNDALRKDNQDLNYRSGILRLCGYVKDNNLYSSLQYAWENETVSNKIELLDDFFWACAHCCGPSPSALLDPIFDTWASLSDKPEKEGLGSDRDNFAASDVRWAFQKYVPTNAIEYIISQTDRDDLRWQITYMLHEIDHPKTVVYLVNHLAKMEKKGTGSFNHFSFT